MRPLSVVNRSIADLKPNPRNARTHSNHQIRQIAASIEEFGFTNPILIDGDDRVIAGHGRLAAAKRLGLEMVPTICIDDLTEAQIRAYVIADNRLAEKAGWDPEILAIELQDLIDLDLEFDVTITGFEMGEIDVLIGGSDPSDEDPKADRVREPDQTQPAVSQPGDLWRLGRHRLICGDATNPAAFSRLLGGEKAQMVFIDPPYNVPIDGHVCGLGGIKHREFAMASGEMSEAEFVGFLKSVFGNLVAHSADGSIHYVCMDWRHMTEVLTAGMATYADFKNLCVWNKSNAGMGAFYRSKHELVFVFKNGTARHINNFGLGENGRHRTNVWDYAGVNTMGEGRLEELSMHPTVKPVALVADAILDCSKRGGIVLDCFAGSGTTVIAAEKTGRRAYVMEIDPVYADTIVRRWETYTGDQAIHEKTDKTFRETLDARSVGASTSEKGATRSTELEVEDVE